MPAACQTSGVRVGTKLTADWVDTQGVASKEDIDKTMKLGMAHPMGPLVSPPGPGLLQQAREALAPSPSGADRRASLRPRSNSPTCEPRAAELSLFRKMIGLTVTLRCRCSIGLDTCLAIQEVLHAQTGDSKYRPAGLLRRMVLAGWLGKKSGKGFYDY